MGVDFFTCNNCEEAFPDCINYCSTCSICRLEVIPDANLLEYLLSRYSLNREQAENLYRESQTL